MTTSRGTKASSRIRPTTLTIAAAAGALVLTATGGAVAGTMITGAQIKNGTVTSADLKNRTLRKADLAPATVAQLRGHRGPAGARGSVRGYAYVNGTTVTRQSGGISVTKAGVGTFCVTVPGVSSADTVPVASLDYSYSATNLGDNAPQAALEISTQACAAPAFGVRTFVRTFPDANTVRLTNSDQPFSILVP